jgi:hypothetical protein
VDGGQRSLNNWDLLGMEVAIYFQGAVRLGLILRIGIDIHLNALNNQSHYNFSIYRPKRRAIRGSTTLRHIPGRRRILLDVMAEEELEKVPADERTTGIDNERQQLSAKL